MTFLWRYDAPEREPRRHRHDPEPVVAALKAKGVDLGGAGTRIRVVTHLDVSRDDVMSAVDAIRDVLNEAKG